MIDKDGIERPDSPDEHVMELKQRKKKVKIKKKTYKNRNLFYLIWCGIIHAIAVLVLNPMFRISRGVRIHGKKEHYKPIKGKTGIITIANHCYNFDMPILCANAFPEKKLWYVTLQSNLELRFFGFMIKSLGAIAIPRQLSKMPLFMDAIDDMLKKKRLIHFMPETALWNYYRDLRPFKQGAFKFAVKNSAPILPMAVTFRFKNEKARKKHAGNPKKYKVDVTYLAPQFPDLTIEKEIDRINELRDRCHANMKAFLDEKYKDWPCLVPVTETEPSVIGEEVSVMTLEPSGVAAQDEGFGAEQSA